MFFGIIALLSERQFLPSSQAEIPSMAMIRVHHYHRPDVFSQIKGRIRR
jgi:hypothetical protein